MEAGRSYWIELLTRPPLQVVASGRDDRLEFKSFKGEVAIIPQRQRESGRFVYRISQPQQKSTGTSDEAEPIAGAMNE